MKGTKWQEWRPHIGEVWRLSLPAILTQITSIVMQYIDSAMVGALGAKARLPSAGRQQHLAFQWGHLCGIGGIFRSGSPSHGGKEPEKARNVERHGWLQRFSCRGFSAFWAFLSAESSPDGWAGRQTFKRTLPPIFLRFR